MTVPSLPLVVVLVEVMVMVTTMEAMAITMGKLRVLIV